MFKKKSNLPARPSIPTKERIQEDLASSSPEDVVFKTDMEKNTLTNDALNDAINDLEEYDPKNIKESEDADEAYSKISSFVDKVNHLEERLATLKEEKGNLSKLEENLLTDMAKVQEELKKQTLSS